MPSGHFSSVLQCWRRWRTSPLVRSTGATKWVTANISFIRFYFNCLIDMNSFRFQQIQKSYQNNNIYRWRRCYRNEDFTKGPKHIQHCDWREQCGFCVFNETPLGRSWTLSTLHVARPEFGFNVAGFGGSAEIPTRCFHRYDGLCIHNASIQIYWRMQGRLLHALSNH